MSDVFRNVLQAVGQWPDPDGHLGDCVYDAAVLSDRLCHRPASGGGFEHYREGWDQPRALAQPSAGAGGQFFPQHPVYHSDGRHASGGKAGRWHQPWQQGYDRHAGDRRRTVCGSYGGKLTERGGCGRDRGCTVHGHQQFSDHHEGPFARGKTLADRRRRDLYGDHIGVLGDGRHHRRNRTGPNRHQLWASAL